MTSSNSTYDMAKKLEETMAENEHLRADVERLRTALVNVRDHSGGCFPGTDRPMCAHCVAITALATTVDK